MRLIYIDAVIFNTVLQNHWMSQSKKKKKKSKFFTCLENYKIQTNKIFR